MSKYCNTSSTARYTAFMMTFSCSVFFYVFLVWSVSWTFQYKYEPALCVQLDTKKPLLQSEYRKCILFVISIGDVFILFDWNPEHRFMKLLFFIFMWSYRFYLLFSLRNLMYLSYLGIFAVINNQNICLELCFAYGLIWLDQSDCSLCLSDLCVPILNQLVASKPQMKNHVSPSI